MIFSRINQSLIGLSKTEDKHGLGLKQYLDGKRTQKEIEAQEKMIWGVSKMFKMNKMEEPKETIIEEKGMIGK